MQQLLSTAMWTWVRAAADVDRYVDAGQSSSWCRPLCGRGSVQQLMLTAMWTRINAAFSAAADVDRYVDAGQCSSWCRPLCGRGSVQQLLSFLLTSVFSSSEYQHLSWNIVNKHFASHFLLTRSHLMKCLSWYWHPVTLLLATNI